MVSTGVEDCNCTQRNYGETLSQMAAVVRTVAAPEQLLVKLLRLLKEGTGAQAAALATGDATANELRGRAPAAGLSPQMAQRLRISLGPDSPIAATWQSGVAAVIEDPRSTSQILPALGPLALLVAPLKLPERTLGLLLVVGEHDRSFKTADLKLAELTAALLAGHLELSESRNRTEQLREASLGWQELLIQISNELRAALTPILTWTQILGRQARLERRWQKAIGVIQRNTLDQARLVDDLLSTAGGSPRTLARRGNPIALSEQIKLAAETVKSQADVHEVTLKVDLLQGDLTIDGNPREVQEIIANLLRNALRSAPRGGVVSVSAALERDCVLLRVTDPHGGFEPARVKRTSDVVHAHATASNRGAGVGVNLGLIRQMVERHGGTIRARSAGPGTGACFEVFLPTGAPQPAPPAIRKLGGLELLVIEDHRDSREALAALLETHGAHVRTAASGEEGLVLALDNPPDVVLCDLAMPGVDGYQVARRLRAQLGWRHLTLLALSAHGTATDVARAQEAGFSAHLLKPVEASRLLEVIEAGLRD